MEPRGQSRAAVANLLRTNQAEGRVLRKTLGVVEVFITSQARIDRLAQQIGKGKLGILAAALILQVVGDELAEAEPLVQLPNQQQAGVGGDS
jgi:hypothetical protein